MVDIEKFNAKARLFNLGYELRDNGEMVITNRYMKKLEIPGFIDYVHIEDRDSLNYLEELKINEGVKSIGEKSFSHCDRLEKVELPHSLEIIGKYAFYHCDNLREMDLKSVYKICDGSFMNCIRLKTIKAGCGSREIDFDINKFKGCGGISIITLGENIKRVSMLEKLWCNRIRVHKSLLDKGIFDEDRIRGYRERKRDEEYIIYS